MKVAIIYTTKYGFTEKCAGLLKKEIHCPTEIFDLEKGNQKPKLDDFDTIILGGSVYAGRIQKELLEYWKQNEKKLSEKKIGLFTCNMYQGEKGEEQLKEVFSEEMLEKSFCTLSFGGRFDFSEMNFLEKMVVKKIAKVEEDVENVLYENIKLMSDKINETCQ